ncbi:MAG: N-acetylmuramic acid 6-phosphate etherase [Actinomycetota bacterium]|nr:N-acetylmuramic acid 6-phosphate etherase [Actinomycetota bacterium]
MDVDTLRTEGVRPGLQDLDVRPAREVVDLLLEAEAELPAVLAAAADEITQAALLAERALAAGGRILYVGAGTPGRLAAMDAAECPPTYGTAPEQVVAVLAGGGPAGLRAVEGAEDDAGAGARDLAAHRPGPADVVIAISASGRTPYVLSALEVAAAAGAATVAVVNNAGSPARQRAAVTVELLTGPEVVAGSTRLTAATAQKIALNAISTTAMVRLGKTYGARMVDVIASNEKLRCRAVRMVREITGADDATATAVLEASGWRAKPAIVALLTGVEVPEAVERLDAVGGRVRDALAGP